MLNKSVLEKLHKKLDDVAPEFDAIINIAATPRSNPISAPLTDANALFEEYERVKRYEMYSSLLTAHLAATHASPDCYILFNSRLAAYNYNLVPKKTEKPSVLSFVKNATVTK